jgi:hypothetical protein
MFKIISQGKFWLLLGLLLGFDAQLTSTVSAAVKPEQFYLSQGLSQNLDSLRNSTKNQLFIADNQGIFKVAYVPVEKQDYQQYEQILQQSQLFEAIATTLNEILILPSDITIVFSECGTINAFYDPQSQAIVMCYELIDDFAKFSAQYAANEEELLQATLGGIMYVLAHELAHALIHVLDIPVVGREEDAADQLAIIIATKLGEYEGKLGEFGKQMAIIPALQYRLKSQNSQEKNTVYWDDHPLDLQRYYNIICLLYGSDTTKYKTLAILAELPGARAQKCPGEYVQAYNGWLRLLQPHLETELTTDSPQSPPSSSQEPQPPANDKILW